MSRHDEDYEDDYDDEEVEIQGPAMKEIRRTRSCIRRTCFSGCGCLVFVIAVVAIGMWLFTPPLPKELSKIPEGFPDTIPLYKAESITLIEHTPSDRKKRGPETAALIPKIVLAPIFLALEEETTSTAPGREAGVSAWHAFSNIVKSPLKEWSETTTLRWENLSAEPEFVDEWYQNELSKASFGVERQFTSSTVRIIDFNKEDTRGIITIKDNDPEQGTDQVEMIVDYAPEN